MATILIVADNNREMRPSVTQLKLHGHNTMSTEPGMDMIAKAGKFRPDMIFINIMALDDSNLRAAEVFLTDESCKHIPLLMVTDMDNTEMVKKSIALDVRAMIPYPLDYDYLQTIIEDITFNKTKKKSVLIADDDRTVSDVMVALFRKSGYNAYKAEDGEEAFQKARSLRPDIVIMDYIMPKCDGLHAIEKIKKVFFLKDMPIIGHTGKITPDVIKESAKHGCNMLLKKPVSKDEILTKVREIIG